MRVVFYAALGAVGVALTHAPVVAAQVLEVRAGIGAHDVGVLSRPAREQSVIVNAEIIFEEPEFLKWALSPQPYVGGNLNLGGGTSYGGAGLLWRQNFGKKFYGDFAFGLVVHDGAKEVEFADFVTDTVDTLAGFDAAFSEFDLARDKSNEYGSRVLFREQLTLGYRLNDTWAMEGFFEHVSHGEILSNGSNDGSDAAGFRVNRRF